MSQPERWYKQKWVLIAVVLVIGVGLGLLVTRVMGGDEPGAGAAGKSDAAPSSSAAGGSGGEDKPGNSNGVDGCLGGTNANKAVVKALKDAPLTDEGLAAAGRAVARWVLQYPLAPNASDIAKQISASETAAETLLDSMLSASQALSVDGFTATTVTPNDSAYKLSKASVMGYDGELSIINVLVYRDLVRANGENEQQKTVVTITLKNVGGEWKFFSGDPIPGGTEQDPEQGDYIEYQGAC